jgi:catechol 2,3-dioxygenase-like lactoylglutathione lyase family enzyme
MITIIPIQSRARRGFSICAGPFLPGSINAMLASSKLQTIVLSSRLPKAEKFYGDVLGLKLKGKSHGALVYDVGGADLRVSPVPSTQPSPHTVLGFAVADLSAVMSALSMRGVEWERFANFPQDAAGVLITPDGARVAWFRDPDGNLLSIVQYA